MFTRASHHRNAKNKKIVPSNKIKNLTILASVKLLLSFFHFHKTWYGHPFFTVNKIRQSVGNKMIGRKEGKG
jgi:hypothetical protein